MIYRDNIPHGDRCPCCFEHMAPEFTVTNAAGTVHVYDCPKCNHMEAAYEQPRRAATQCGALGAVAGILRVFVAEMRTMYAMRDSE